MSNEMRDTGEVVGHRNVGGPEGLAPPGAPSLSPDMARHEISFNDVARRYDDAYLGGKWLGQKEQSSPFLIPDIMQRAIDQHHTRHGLLWSYGGYLENRTQLWRGSYLSCTPDEFLHAGIDMNLPAKSPVVCTRGGVVRIVGDDRDTQGGWGPFLVVETQREGKKEFVLYAHLGDIFVQRGQRIEPFSTVAVIGAPPHNGGWWSHLHIQCIEERYFMWCHKQGLMDILDAYFPKAATEFHKPIFADPIDLVWNPEELPKTPRG